MSVHAINYVNNHLKPSQSRTKPCRPAWQKQGWNMDFARCGCHLADIQEPVSDHTSWPLRINAGRRESKTASAVPGGGHRLPQRFPSEISSILQVPDRRLEQAKASARGFFGFPIALQLIFALQAGPLIRIDGFNV